MLFRVAGKLASNKTFSARIEALNAIAAVAAVVTGLTAQNVQQNDVAEVRATPMKGKSSVYIGDAKAPRARKPGKPGK